jgi:hypothetical protein
MLKYTASTMISAPVETIWTILTDASHYTEWDENMIKLDGTIAPGEQLTIYTKLAPKRAFKPKVVEFTPNRKMVWQSGMPMGLFTGSRTFDLQPNGDQVTFTMTEEFKGPMLAMIRGSIPDMTPVFETFVKAVKARAEEK